METRLEMSGAVLHYFSHLASCQIVKMLGKGAFTRVPRVESTKVNCVNSSFQRK
jgi:hypothetical protein